MQISPFDATALQLRRRSFQLALADQRVQGALIVASARRTCRASRFARCCAYPTLSTRGIHDICDLCWWEDDGQDDPNADDVGRRAEQ